MCFFYEPWRIPPQCRHPPLRASSGCRTRWPSYLSPAPAPSAGTVLPRPGNSNVEKTRLTWGEMWPYRPTWPTGANKTTWGTWNKKTPQRCGGNCPLQASIAPEPLLGLCFLYLRANRRRRIFLVVVNLCALCVGRFCSTKKTPIPIDLADYTAVSHRFWDTVG